MPLADKLTAALLARVGMRPDITASKVQAHLEKLPFDERESLVHHLLACSHQSTEWQAFIEPFLIHETYFFRHENQLEFLATTVLPRLIQERLKANRLEFRIWCAACSSGEEAYTAALLLRDAIQGIREASSRDWRLSVVGTDLSAEVLSKARAGEYSMSAGLNSFRDVPAFARHHFTNIFQRGEKRGPPMKHYGGL